MEAKAEATIDTSEYTDSINKAIVRYLTYKGIVQFPETELSKYVDIIDGKITRWDFKVEQPTSEQLEEHKKYDWYGTTQTRNIKDRVYFIFLALRERLGMSEEEMTELLDKYYNVE